MTAEPLLSIFSLLELCSPGLLSMQAPNLRVSQTHQGTPFLWLPPLQNFSSLYRCNATSSSILRQLHPTRSSSSCPGPDFTVASGEKPMMAHFSSVFLLSRASPPPPPFLLPAFSFSSASKSFLKYYVHSMQLFLLQESKSNTIQSYSVITEAPFLYHATCSIC